MGRPCEGLACLELSVGTSSRRGSWKVAEPGGLGGRKKDFGVYSKSDGKLLQSKEVGTSVIFLFVLK